MRKGNEYIRIDDETLGIVLNTKRICLIDAEDYDKVKNYTWIDTKSSIQSWSKETKHISIQTIILGKSHVAKKDKNYLNCKKNNLETQDVFSKILHSRNMKIGKTGYIGVTKEGGIYRPSIAYNHKKIHLGSFKTAEEAARVRDAKAIELYGKCARLNFPIQ